MWKTKNDKRNKWVKQKKMQIHIYINVNHGTNKAVELYEFNIY